MFLTLSDKGNSTGLVLAGWRISFMTVMRKGQVSLFYTPLWKTNPVFSVLTKEVLNKNFHQMGTQKKKKHNVTNENILWTYGNKNRNFQHSGPECSYGVCLTLRGALKTFQGIPEQKGNFKGNFLHIFTFRTQLSLKLSNLKHNKILHPQCFFHSIHQRHTTHLPSSR